jgi:hypothetical protein
MSTVVGVSSFTATNIIGSYTATRTATTTDYTVLSTDDIVGCDTSSNTIEITLPAASSIGAGKRYSIKDEGGNAGLNNITVTPDGSDTIDGDASKTIDSAYTSMTIYCNGSNGWFVE